MRRPGRIALGAALVGLMLAATAGIAMHWRERGQPKREARVPAGAQEHAAAPEVRTLTRCRTLTMPDSGCEAAWEARRRHFFGQDSAR
ncbi:conjugative transfer region protein TrbK [Novosphingobium hassiacum]|uniref:Conjugative transfer region protein TrbK n=1 Tax=Novosphingobium hassiacum TaxID=173676 RepID=A0A7W6A0B1_9SPHN|nr:putative entry exclusion protein TrbK-alt [Novosphingobium hassiacum]MBB3862464.1 conjugative transfer region protein TrbK [Novosphingobium hassiacum]